MYMYTMYAYNMCTHVCMICMSMYVCVHMWYTLHTYTHMIHVAHMYTTIRVYTHILTCVNLKMSNPNIILLLLSLSCYSPQ
jgi:hypothetical protein